jgi:frataxin
MSSSAFETLADSLLEALEEGLDGELQGGVLTVEGEAGTWIVNKHAATRQIWLSSPKSGARHYAFEEARGLWQDTRGGADLLTTLSGELGVALDWQPE